MQYRPLGKTGLSISEIGVGCGGTSGLMGRGTPEQRREVVARALELGINYFDTAPAYDGTRSETGLGETLKELGARAIIGTKVRLEPSQLSDIPAAVATSVEGSLRRLQVETIDLIQVHNRPALELRRWDHDALGIQELLGPRGVVESMERLREQGKVRHIGFTAIGEVPAFDALLESDRLETVQSYFNLLNPSAGMHVPVGFRGADYGTVIDRAGARGMGVLVIRALAAGALTSLSSLHPLAGGWSQRAAHEVEADRVRAHALSWLLEGTNDSITQVALRFALTKPETSTVLVGFSDVDQVDEACAASGKPPIPSEHLEKLSGFYFAD
ncbi:MAG TPA: aldo/keto reductase [Chloroflexota bacterium]|nr:aldo/keto reductase [Chloroflexota bacterium]